MKSYSRWVGITRKVLAWLQVVGQTPILSDLASRGQVVCSRTTRLKWECGLRYDRHLWVRAGISSHPEDTSGPYLPLAWGAANQWVGWDWTRAGLLVGKLTTTASVPAPPVKSYISDAALDTDSNLITWDASYNFTETNVMTHLWSSCMARGRWNMMPSASAQPMATWLVLNSSVRPRAARRTRFCGHNSYDLAKCRHQHRHAPMSHQWRSNGVDIVDATNATLVLTIRQQLYGHYSVT